MNAPLPLMCERCGSVHTLVVEVGELFCIACGHRPNETPSQAPYVPPRHLGRPAGARNAVGGAA